MKTLASTRLWASAFLALAAALAAAHAHAAVLPENPPWTELKTPAAHMYSQADEARTRSFAASLAQFRDTLPRVANGLAYPQSLPVTFFAFRDSDAMLPYEPKGLESVPGLLGGFYLGDKRGGFIALRAYLPGNPLETVFHEMIHAAQFRRYPSLPLWLQEGEADYYSSLRIEGTRAEVGLAVGRHADWFAAKAPEPLPWLFGVTQRDRGGFARDTTIGFYATSWALVHFLRHTGAEHRAMLEKYQADLAAGVPESKAHLSAFGMKRAELETAFREYVAAGNFVSESIAVPAIESRAPGEIRPAPRAHLLARLGLLQMAPYPPNLAGAADHIRAAAALAPEDPLVLAALGSLEYRNRRCTAAVPYFRRALEKEKEGSDPAQLFEAAAAVLCLPQAGEPGQVFAKKKLDDAGKADVLLARGWLQQGLKTYPEDVQGLASLGLTYVRLGDSPAEGIPALETALRLDPKRDDVAWNLFELYLAAGDRARAQALLDGSITKQGDDADIARARRNLAEFDLRRATQLVNEGKLDEALVLLRGIGDGESNPDAKAKIAAEVSRLEAHAARKREIDAYNAAVDLAKKGDASKALRDLRKLVESCKDEEVCANARNAVKSLTEAGVRP